MRQLRIGFGLVVAALVGALTFHILSDERMVRPEADGPALTSEVAHLRSEVAEQWAARASCSSTYATTQAASNVNGQFSKDGVLLQTRRRL